MTTLYVSDLDGTLLQPDATLSERAHHALVELIEAGLLFTIATARSVVHLRPHLRDLPLRLPVIGLNGGSVTDYRTGRHHSVETLPAGVVRAVCAAMRAHGVDPILSTMTDRDRVYVGRSPNGGQQWYVDDRSASKDPRLTRVDDVRAHLAEPTACVTAIGPREALVALNAELVANFGASLYLHLFENTPYSPGWWWVTVGPQRATKAHGIAALRRMVPEVERVVVFGDQLNDLPMFRAADRAVAVANAHPEVLDAACEVIGSNTEDSVVHWLRRHGRASSRQA